MPKSAFVVRRTSQEYKLFRDKQPLLHHIDLELTERCNNNCMHCYINLPENDLNAIKNELTTDAWKDILRQAADLGALSVRFTGGEPLLRNDFQELYLYARKIGMKVVLFTNARLITEELANLFEKVPPLKKIAITVYGLNSQSYDAVARQCGAYNEFKQGIDYLIERQIPFYVRSTFLPPNLAEVDAFKKWASNINGSEANYAVFLNLRARHDSNTKNILINSLRLPPKQVVTFLSKDINANRKAMAPFVAKSMYPAGDRLFDCGAGKNGCVDAYGHYQLCMMLRHPDTVYDLGKGTLKEALTDFFPQICKLYATNPDYLERCSRCFLMGLCEQCPAKSWTEHGTLDTPVEYFCEVAHAQARVLGLISKDEKAWEVSNWQERITAFLEMVEQE